MTRQLEDNTKNYYVVCLDVLGFKSLLRENKFKEVNLAYRLFQDSFNEVIKSKSVDEITRFVLLGDSFYFICERLETALNGIRLFGHGCIDIAIDFKKGYLKNLIPFMVRGGISYGPILLYFSDEDKSVSTSNKIYNPFNAIGLPLVNAYILSEKSKGLRVAVDDEDNDVKIRMLKNKKYFSKQRDLNGNYYYEFLWPLCIFKRRDSKYILDTLEAFWHLLERNRGDHEIQYLSTLALFWKSVDLTSQQNVAKFFFESKLDEYPDEIDYIRVLKKYDFFIRLNKSNQNKRD
jgi:hypothetical protein